jgi:osmotically-inducible protein OsmY
MGAEHRCRRNWRIDRIRDRDADRHGKKPAAKVDGCAHGAARYGSEGRNRCNQRKLPGDSERSDADIARAAVNALDWNVSVPRNRVTVVVEHGRITLEGELRFHYEKVAAERAVRHLIGVTGVSNLISVKPPKVSAGDVKHRIEQALERAAELDAGKISVQADDGKVTLSGTVKSWTERDEAEWAAWAAPGVSRVENDIRITP